MSDIVVREAGQIQLAVTANEIRAQVNRIQEVMAAVMKNGVHYGKVPGCGDKPALFKPGAEKILATFQIAVDPQVESETRTEDEYTVRIRAVATAPNGRCLGAAVGEASSNEEKYRWRKAVCEEEYDETPADRRRLAFKKWDGKIQRIQQVRVNVADVSNTILKMAVKRAEVAVCLQVTAASDVFAQDIEDLPPEVAADLQGDVKPPIKAPMPKAQAPAPAPAPATANAEPKAPVPAPDPDRAAKTGEFEVNTTFAEVKTKEGQSAKGPWCRYFVKAEDGEFYSTFSFTLGKKMEGLCAVPVTILYVIKDGPKGPNREVVDIWQVPEKQEAPF
jgi:hypothetical protein